MIGGGPAGSSCASLLAARGVRVLLLERERFPRYHIGESLIPGCLRALDAMGVSREVADAGFVIKRGVSFAWGKNREPFFVDFDSIGATHEYAYQVDRARFDEILLRHAQRCGAEVREECAVERVAFLEEGAEVFYEGGSARARWLVDASGQDALLARTMRLRRFDPALDNVAVWRYFRGAGRLAPPRQGYISALKAGEGWWWYIPLELAVGGLTSVGWVTGVTSLRGRKESISALYDARRGEVPELIEWLAHATPLGEVRTTRDWSYRSERVSGDSFLLAGDAGGFIDPILSSGCYLALTAGYLAALCIHTAWKNPAMRAPAWRYYETTYNKIVDEIHRMVLPFNQAVLSPHDYFEIARGIVTAPPGGDPQLYFGRLIAGESGIGVGGLLPREIFGGSSRPQELYGVPSDMFEARVLREVSDELSGSTEKMRLVEQNLELRLEPIAKPAPHRHEVEDAFGHAHGVRLPIPPVPSLRLLYRREEWVLIQIVPAAENARAFRKKGKLALSYYAEDGVDPYAEPRSRALITQIASAFEGVAPVDLAELERALRGAALPDGWSHVGSSLTM